MVHKGRLRQIGLLDGLPPVQRQRCRLNLVHLPAAQVRGRAQGRVRVEP
jgi:hypothetical protein